MPLAVFQTVRGTGWIGMMSLWVNHKQGQSCDQFSLPRQTFNRRRFLWKTFKVAKRHASSSWNEWYPNSASLEWMVPASRKLLSLVDVADRSPALKRKPPMIVDLTWNGGAEASSGFSPGGAGDHSLPLSSPFLSRQGLRMHSSLFR